MVHNVKECVVSNCEPYAKCLNTRTARILAMPDMIICTAGKHMNFKQLSMQARDHEDFEL